MIEFIFKISIIFYFVLFNVIEKKYGKAAKTNEL